MGSFGLDEDLFGGSLVQGVAFRKALRKKWLNPCAFQLQLGYAINKFIRGISDMSILD